MVEYNTYEEIASLPTLTGNKDKSRYLYYQLQKSFEKATSVDIIVSFLMTSGVSLLIKDIKKAIKRGCKIRVLTGTYLGITQPEALALLKKECSNLLDLRFFVGEKNQSFHPKAYIFHNDNNSELYIGSSNISYSALTSGVEWNYRISKNEKKEDFSVFYNTFLDLFNNHSVSVTDKELKSYASSYHKPSILKDIEKLTLSDSVNNDYNSDLENESHNIIPLFEPRGAQIEALYALDKLRQEGGTKGLIYAATGVGKTYLAAFDSKDYKTVLFIAHQEELLKQAQESFHNIRPNDSSCLFYSKEKDIRDSNGNLKHLVFASVQSLCKEESLSLFPKDYFEYIVIDEFHHAVNDSYKKIINYFTPKFLLGLTATPERTDGRNIYELLDYNVPFEISLFQGINRGLLVPFHYYGICDKTTDYSNFALFKGRYKESDLNDAYIDNTLRDNLILRNYRKYNSKRALGFCCSRLHALYMAKVFNNNGIPSVAVFSGNDEDENIRNRDEAIKELKKGKIKVIFSVNMFNEGVDIPSVDTVMFLRATDSDVVFLQQLGRGLRLSKGKEYLNVLDFIGNYKNAGKFIKLLSGEKQENNLENSPAREGDEEDSSSPFQPEALADGCFIDFDLDLIDLLENLNKKKENSFQKIKEEFYRIKEDIGHIPSRMDLFLSMDSSLYDYTVSHSNMNLFKFFLTFLNEEGLLTREEEEIFKCEALSFIHECETTSMTKIYKMPVLMSFYDKEKNIIKPSLSNEELLKGWKAFFNENSNWKDLPSISSYDEYKAISDKSHLDNILKNPVNFLIKSSKGLFIKGKENPIEIKEEIRAYLSNPSLVYHYLDIINYRSADYYKRRYKNNK